MCTMYSQSSQVTNFAPGAFYQEQMERRRQEEDLAAQQLIRAIF